MFRKQIDGAGISLLSPLGLVAFEAAYRQGEDWYLAMKAYVSDNIDFIRNYTEENLPGVSVTEHEGTYLVWVDFRKTGLDPEELEDLIINKCRLWLDSGKIFGKCGSGFQRINAACPRVVLNTALERIKTELNAYKYNEGKK